jgi:hypothetical protein
MTRASRKKTSPKTPRTEGAKRAKSTRSRAAADAPAMQQPFAIKRSGIQGKGAFAVRTIAKGERIIEYTGELISNAEASRRYDDSSMRRHHTFLFAVTSRRCIDGARGGNDARYLNHSCAPNCEARQEGVRIFIHATRRIRAGEELTYDYAYGETGEAEELYLCKCGAKTCRGTILAR